MKTHRKDGTPTAYGFACGYGIKHEQAVEGGASTSVSLFLVNGVFEIKSLDWSKNTGDAHAWGMLNGWNDPYDFRKWKTATTVHEARRLFRAECLRLGLRAT